jgi:hypothetical protein
LISIRLTYNSPFSVWILVRKPREEVPLLDKNFRMPIASKHGCFKKVR